MMFPWTTAATRLVEEDIACAAASRGNVMITGERGTGKRSVAELIHRKSGRREGPFVIGGRLDLIDYTCQDPVSGPLRAAHNGSFLLEELDAVNPHDGADLVRFVDCGVETTNVRFMAATSIPLCDRVQAGQFPENLFYRLNVIHVILAPLRERPEDIPVLLRHFMLNSGAASVDFSPAAWDRLSAYSWPGNLQQLKAFGEALAGDRTRRQLDVADLPAEILAA